MSLCHEPLVAQVVQILVVQILLAGRVTHRDRNTISSLERNLLSSYTHHEVGAGASLEAYAYNKDRQMN